jgi:hypothetical protein
MNEKEKDAEEMLQKRIDAARIIPDIAGRDIGSSALFLANENVHPLEKLNEQLYFVQ